MSKIIYKVTHKETGKVYIGATKDLNKRKRDHIQKANKESGYRFQQAIATYGEDAFEWEEIDTAFTPGEAAEKERDYILKYHSKKAGFNSDQGGGLQKKVYQYDIQGGNLIGLYESLEAAGSAVGVNKKTISKACLGELKTSAGYCWSYKKYDHYPLKKDIRKKRVFQYNMEGKFLNSFRSVAEASRKTEVNKSSIAKCCNGNYHQAGGFKWKFNK